MKHTTSSFFVANLRLIQQQELHFAPPLYRADGLAFPTAEGNVFLVNIPVSGFQPADEPAFRVSALTRAIPLDPHYSLGQSGVMRLFYILRNSL